MRYRLLSRDMNSEHRVLRAIGIMKVQTDCDSDHSLTLKMESLHGKPDSTLFEGTKLSIM